MAPKHALNEPSRLIMCLLLNPCSNLTPCTLQQPYTAGPRRVGTKHGSQFPGHACTHRAGRERQALENGRQPRTRAQLPMAEHACDSYCDSIHRRVIGKALMTISDGRPGLGPPSPSAGPSRLVHPHAPIPSAANTKPRATVDKWVLQVTPPPQLPWSSLTSSLLKTKSSRAPSVI